MKFSSTLAAAATLVATVSAHGGVGVYTIGGTAYQGWSPYNSASGQKSIQRQYGSFDPLYIADLSKVNIRCNNAGALGSGVSAPVAAGDKIKTKWTQWTHRPSAVMIYMARCPSSGCNNWDGAGKVWFKIDHQGLVSGTQNAGKWAGDAIVDTLEWTTTVPKTLAPGEYLIRHELLALHQANNPQFYPECAQLTVTGSGSVVPSSSWLVSFPGAYSGSDPGIAFNIDSPDAMKATTYPIPGPPVWDGTGTDAPKADPPAASPTSAPSAPTPEQPKPTCAAVSKFGQCGGTGFKGCTVCASGSTCTKSSDYYHQCL
jgi:hypothetical protein